MESLRRNMSNRYKDQARSQRMNNSRREWNTIRFLQATSQDPYYNDQFQWDWNGSTWDYDWDPKWNVEQQMDMSTLNMDVKNMRRYEDERRFMLRFINYDLPRIYARKSVNGESNMSRRDWIIFRNFREFIRAMEVHYGRRVGYDRWRHWKRTGNFDGDFEIFESSGFGMDRTRNGNMDPWEEDEYREMYGEDFYMDYGDDPVTQHALGRSSSRIPGNSVQPNQAYSSEDGTVAVQPIYYQGHRIHMVNGQAFKIVNDEMIPMSDWIFSGNWNGDLYDAMVRNQRGMLWDMDQILMNLRDDENDMVRRKNYSWWNNNRGPMDNWYSMTGPGFNSEMRRNRLMDAYGLDSAVGNWGNRRRNRGRMTRSMSARSFGGRDWNSGTNGNNYDWATQTWGGVGNGNGYSNYGYGNNNYGYNNYYNQYGYGNGNYGYGNNYYNNNGYGNNNGSNNWRQWGTATTGYRNGYGNNKNWWNNNTDDDWYNWRNYDNNGNGNWNTNSNWRNQYRNGYGYNNNNNTTSGYGTNGYDNDYYNNTSDFSSSRRNRGMMGSTSQSMRSPSYKASRSFRG